MKTNPFLQSVSLKTIKPMLDKFKNRYRIPSGRLSTWDYSSNAAYFITICTTDRQHYFGKIIDAEIQLSKIGKYANDSWMNIPHHFPYFYLDVFVIMPNHVHGIVLIENPYMDNRSDFNFVETRHALSLQKTNNEDHETKQPHPRFRNQGRNTISAMVGSFKSAVTKFCNENKFQLGWQSRFHDHILRDTKEFHSIRNYIITNPDNWKNDKFYSE